MAVGGLGVPELALSAGCGGGRLTVVEDRVVDAVVETLCRRAGLTLCGR